MTDQMLPEAEIIEMLPADKRIPLRLRVLNERARTQMQARTEAEKLIIKSMVQFEVELGNDIVRLAEHAASLEGNPQKRAHIIKIMRRAAHDIKAQGKTYGYDLISELATSICDCLNCLTDVSPRIFAAINGHINAMEMIYSKKIKGKGSLSEQQTLLALREAISLFKTQKLRHKH